MAADYGGGWEDIPAHCEHCGAPLRARDPDYPGPGPAARFCSGRCKAAAHRARGYQNPHRRPRPPRQLTCAVCGSGFVQAGTGRSRVTCSPPCADRRRRRMAS